MDWWLRDDPGPIGLHRRRKTDSKEKPTSQEINDMINRGVSPDMNFRKRYMDYMTVRVSKAKIQILADIVIVWIVLGIGTYLIITS